LQCNDPYSAYNATLGYCVQTCALSYCQLCKPNSNICDQCAIGYSRYQWNDRCIPTPIEKCLVVYDFPQQEFMCIKCSTNLVPTKDQFQCMVDIFNCNNITNCISCNSNTCLTCIIGYTFSLNSSVCLLNSCNITNCFLCSFDSSCFRCFSNYTLSNGACIPGTCNLINCLICKPSSQFCDIC
jgi:hypothetical protein